MFQILKESIAEIVEKKSRFITRIKPVDSEEQALKIVKEIAKIEKGAVHNCFAFRILNSRNNLIERKADDGEPGGTAGAPMLAVLSGENLVNVLAVTTRYFGGIKLGTGGLVNVYKRGIQEALKYSGKKEYKILVKYKIIFPINAVTHAEYLLKKENINIVNKIFDSKVSFIVEISEDIKDKLKYIVDKIDGEIKKE